jgi:hypothetical protein
MDRKVLVSVVCLGQGGEVRSLEGGLLAGPEKEQHSLLEILIATSLMLVVTLLAGNVFVLCENSAFNDKACKAAVLCAADAAESGTDVQQAALLGLNQYSGGGFCVTHPEFTRFKEVNEHGMRALEIQTRVLAHLPAPFLIPNLKVEPGGGVPISRTYRVTIDSAANAKQGSR